MSQTSTHADFDRLILGPLGGLAFRLRAYLLAEGLARLAVLAGCAAGVQLLLDWMWHLPTDMRAVLLGVVVLVLAVTIWRRLLRPMTSTLDPPAMTQLVERRFVFP